MVPVESLAVYERLSPVCNRSVVWFEYNWYNDQATIAANSSGLVSRGLTWFVGVWALKIQCLINLHYVFVWHECVMWWGVINLMHRDTVGWKLDALVCGEARPTTPDMLTEEYPTQDCSNDTCPSIRVPKPKMQAVNYSVWLSTLLYPIINRLLLRLGCM